MTRKHRTFVKGMPVHVVQRGVNKCDIFANNKDRSKYLEVLIEAADQHDCPVHSYVLMANHVIVMVYNRPCGTRRDSAPEGFAMPGWQLNPNGP